MNIRLHSRSQEQSKITQHTGTEIYSGRFTNPFLTICVLSRFLSRLLILKRLNREPRPEKFMIKSKSQSLAIELAETSFDKLILIPRLYYKRFLGNCQ